MLDALLRTPAWIRPALALAAAVALSACRTQAGGPTVVAPPVGGLVAQLEDEVRDLPGDRIGWSTYWRLCWREYPAARGYELETLTGEGASPKLRRQDDRCVRVQAAAGENGR